MLAGLPRDSDLQSGDDFYVVLFATATRNMIRTLIDLGRQGNEAAIDAVWQCGFEAASFMENAEGMVLTHLAGCARTIRKTPALIGPLMEDRARNEELMRRLTIPVRRKRGRQVGIDTVRINLLAETLFDYVERLRHFEPVKGKIDGARALAGMPIKTWRQIRSLPDFNKDRAVIAKWHAAFIGVVQSRYGSFAAIEKLAPYTTHRPGPPPSAPEGAIKDALKQSLETFARAKLRPAPDPTEEIRQEKFLGDLRRIAAEAGPVEFAN
jgi:hypothetical protein